MANSPAGTVSRQMQTTAMNWPKWEQIALSRRVFIFNFANCYILWSLFWFWEFGDSSLSSTGTSSSSSFATLTLLFLWFYSLWHTQKRKICVVLAARNHRCAADTGWFAFSLPRTVHVELHVQCQCDEAKLWKCKIWMAKAKSITRGKNNPSSAKNM